MTYRDIVVLVDAEPASAGLVQAAAALAKPFGATLEGVFARTSFPTQFFAAEPFPGLSLFVLPEVVGQHDAAMAEAAEAARMRFEAAAGEAGVRSDWTVIDGDTPDAMVAVMRRCDLTVLPRRPASALAANSLTPARLSLAGGGPVVLMPEDAADRPIGRRVLVAWNGGREAARALRDAMPLLQDAEKVFVLTVDPSGEGGPEGLLQRHLERHGLEAEVIIDRNDDFTAAALMLEQIERLEADLLVMGLYGHSRLQELALGGVSQDMLNRCPIPILASH